MTPVVFVFVLEAAAKLLSIGECHDDPLTLRIQENTISAVCGKHRARSHRGDTQELGYIRSQATPRSIKLGYS